MEYRRLLVAVLVMMPCFINCSETSDEPPTTEKTFYFGADLSYANQILDFNGVYRDGGEIRSPYRIFKDRARVLFDSESGIILSGQRKFMEQKENSCTTILRMLKKE